MFAMAPFNRRDFVCVLKNRCYNIFPRHQKSLLKGGATVEEEYLRDLAIELNNVAVDLYSNEDYSFSMILYKEAIKGIMATIQEKENRVVSIKEAKNTFIARIVEGKERLHKMTYSSSKKGHNEGLGSYQWSDPDSGIGPQCISEAIKISNCDEYIPQDKGRFINAAIMMHNIALVHIKNGEFDVAEDILELAVGLRPLSGDTEEHISNALIFAPVLNNLGYIKYREDNLNEACEKFSDALDIGNQIMIQPTNNDGAAVNAETVRRQKYVGTIFFNVGIINSYLELDDKIKKAFEYSLMLQKMALGKNHPDIAVIEHNIGMIYLEIGRVNEAEKAFLEALRLARFAYGNDHEDVAKELFHLGHIHAMKGEYDKSLKIYKETLSVQRKVLGVNHNHSLITMCEIGKIHHATGNLDKALSTYNESLVIAKKIAGILSIPVVSILCKICKIYIEIGEICEASEIHREVAKKIKYFNRMNIAVDKVEFAQITYLLETPPAAGAA